MNRPMTLSQITDKLLSIGFTIREEKENETLCSYGYDKESPEYGAEFSTTIYCLVTSAADTHNPPLGINVYWIREGETNTSFSGVPSCESDIDVILRAISYNTPGLHKLYPY